MPYTLQIDNFYFVIKLTNLTKENEDTKHFYYGCEICKGNMFSRFCVACNKVVGTARVYPSGEPLPTGSADLFDLQRVAFGEFIKTLPKVNSWKLVELSSVKKPKASEMQKFLQQQKLSGGSPSLEEFAKELAETRTAIKGSIVLKEGKLNEVFFINYYNKLVATIVDTNKQIDKNKLNTEQVWSLVEAESEREKPKKKLEKEIEA